MFDLKTNVLIKGQFMYKMMKSADHLGLEFDQIVIACQDTNFEGIKTLFDVSLRADCGKFLRNFEFIHHDVWGVNDPLP